MGLDLSTCDGGEYRYSYRMLHYIREIALKICGYDKDALKFYKEFEGEVVGKFTRFWQLLHFSDCEGILVHEGFLEGIDYSKSYELGNSDRLLRELEDIKEQLKKHPKLAEKHIKDAFNVFYEDIRKEVEDCCGIVRFC